LRAGGMWDALDASPLAPPSSTTRAAWSPSTSAGGASVPTTAQRRTTPASTTWRSAPSLLDRRHQGCALGTPPAPHPLRPARRAPTTRPGQRNPRGDAREASAAAEAYEELGQRLAVITLALHAIERGGAGSAPAAAIRLAVDEARRQVRFLCGRGERPGTTSIAGL